MVGPARDHRRRPLSTFRSDPSARSARWFLTEPCGGDRPLRASPGGSSRRSSVPRTVADRSLARSSPVFGRRPICNDAIHEGRTHRQRLPPTAPSSSIPKRIGIVDEPDQPAESWGTLTYARGRPARARHGRRRSTRWASGVGERVAIVSHNSARLLTSFFGVSGSGRVLVPINFRLVAEEVRYIVEHCGARVLLVDPELDDALADVDVRAPVHHRRPRPTHELDALRRRAAAVDLRRGRHRDHQLHERHDGPPEGRAADPSQHSGSTPRPSGGRSASSDRDVYLHTLPMFHCNGWGVPYAATGMGVDAGGDPQDRRRRDPAPRRPSTASPSCAARRPWPTWSSTPPPRGTGRSPAATGCASSCAGAPPPTRTIERVETELGWEFIQIYGLTETAPLLTMNRGRAEFDDLTPADRAAKLSRAGAPAIGVDIRITTDGEIARPRQPRDGRLLGAARRDGRRDPRR